MGEFFFARGRPTFRFPALHRSQAKLVGFWDMAVLGRDLLEALGGGMFVGSQSWFSLLGHAQRRVSKLTLSFLASAKKGPATLGRLTSSGCQRFVSFHLCRSTTPSLQADESRKRGVRDLLEDLMAGLESFEMTLLASD